MATRAPTIPFPNGSGKIPVIGLGTLVFGQQDNVDEVEVAVKAAIDAGYRHIDTAWCYGTEESVGKAISAKIAEGVTKREDMFVTTKLWNTHHNPNMVMNALKDSLQKLKLDYIDLFLIHWPTALQDSTVTDPMLPKDENDKVLWTAHKLEDVYKAVEECKKAGLAKDIGISNFNTVQITRIMNSCTMKPVCNQIEVTPSETTMIILRFHIQNGMVVIPKSVTPSRVRDNFEIFDFELSDNEMTKIASLNQNLRVFQGLIFIGHPEYPFDEPL